MSAGASPVDHRFAGRYADSIFMPGRTRLEQCRAAIQDILSDLIFFGMTPSSSPRSKASTEPRATHGGGVQVL